MSHPRNRAGWYSVAGGLAIGAVAVAYGFAADYGWLYAAWFGWVSPLMVAIGVMTLRHGGKSTGDRGPRPD
jgi:hypothetical protein